MIIQYKPQTATGGITPRLAKCPILKRQTVFPNSHSQFQFASIINNNQMNDATIIILCKIVVLRIISKKPIISPYLFDYLVILILITFSNPSNSHRIIGNTSLSVGGSFYSYSTETSPSIISVLRNEGCKIDCFLGNPITKSF